MDGLPSLNKSFTLLDGEEFMRYKITYSFSDSPKYSTPILIWIICEKGP